LFFCAPLASLLIGITSIVPQLILPLAASLSAPEERGKVVGTIEWTLSRDFVVQNLKWFYRRYSWLACYVLDCLRIMSRIIFIIKKQFPYNKPVFNGSYKQLIGSFHLNQGATFIA
jgi:hypothetical protein